jgi:glutathione S-transferase
MSKELIFYTNPQSRGAIAHWMLEEVGAPYQTKVLDFGTTMKAPEYLAINPMGKVPALVHDGTVVTEAAAICAYLADAFPEAGLAPPPESRGEYYRWLFFAAACFEPAVSNHAMGWDSDDPKMMGRLGYGSYEDVLDTTAVWLTDRKYVTGNRFTAADVYLGSQIGFGMAFGIIEKRPEFVNYWDGLKDRPAHLRSLERIEAMKSN